MIQRDMKPSLTSLSDSDLITHVGALAAEERCATAALVAALAELDARRLYLGAGCASLFVYCTRVLHLSESAAYSRIETARAVRRFPTILERRLFRRPCPRRAGRSCRRSHRTATKSRSPCRPKDTNGCAARRTSCVMSCRLGTSRRSSSGRWRCSSPTSRRRRPPPRPVRAPRVQRARMGVTSRRRSRARSGRATTGSAHSRAPRAAARSADSSNTTTSSPSRMEAPRRWRISSCGAPRTMRTRPRCGQART